MNVHARRHSAGGRQGKFSSGTRGVAIGCVAVLLLGMTAIWHEAVQPAAQPDQDIMVIAVKPGARPAAIQKPPISLSVAGSSASGLNNGTAPDPSSDRIDPMLDPLLAVADTDVRSMHDQLSRQERGSLQHSRETTIAALFRAQIGVDPKRVICAGAMCEVIGTADLSDGKLPNRLAEAMSDHNLSPGPVVVRSSSPGTSPMFVQYVEQ